MAQFYGLKIRSGVMKLEDVQPLWRTMTEKWLEAHPEA